MSLACHNASTRGTPKGTPQCQHELSHCPRGVGDPFHHLPLLVQPTVGPYRTSRTVLSNPALDGTLIDGPYANRTKEVVVTAAVPSSDNPDETFPIIAYAHGALGGGVDINGYDPFFHQLASHGFVIVAHKSCTLGCKDIPSKWTECAGLDFDVARTFGLERHLLPPLDIPPTPPQTHPESHSNPQPTLNGGPTTPKP